MKVLPVVGRELRAISRRPSAYWMRSGSALVAFAAVGYVALIGAVGLSTASQGRDLFAILSYGAVAYCLLAGVRGTSDALSQEKREGTLGLLFLTDLKGYDVVLGKLVSVSINSIYGILAVAPPLALAFMLGGTNATQFVMMIVFLLNTLFFSLAVGILVSTFAQQDRPAMGATLAIIFVNLVMPYGIAAAYSYGNLEIWEVMEPGFLLTSPAFAFWAITGSTLLRIYFDEVLLSLAFTNLAGWLCLVIASASIASRAHADAPRGKILAWFARIRQQWAYGKAHRRRAIRSALLDRNAFAWLAGRDRLKQRYAWTFLFLLGGLWLFMRWKAPEITEEWPVALFSLWFVHFFFKVWIGSEVAARFIEDRRSNGLELLLTTPLKLRDFIQGERLALLSQFGLPLAAIVLLNIFAGLRAIDSSAFLIRSPEPIHFFYAGLIHLGFDLYAIHWVAIWRSLHLRGTNRTISQTIALIIFIPLAGWFFIWQGSWLAFAISGRGGPSAEQILWIWTIFCVFWDLLLAVVARRAFYGTFREAATKPFDKPTPFRWRFSRASRANTAPSPPIQTAIPAKLRFTRVRKIAIACALLLLAGYVAVVVRKIRLKSAVAARLAAIRSSGLPVTTTDLLMWRRQPPPSESGSFVLRRASKLLVGSTSPIQLIDTEAHWNSTEALPPRVKEKILAWISQNRPIYEILEELPNRQPGGITSDPRFPAPLKTYELTQILQMKARVELEDDPAAAAKTIRTLLYYARDLEGEPFYAFFSCRKAIESASRLLERGAVQRVFPAENWREWKSILADSNPIGTLRTNLIALRVEGLETFSLPVGALYYRFGVAMGNFPAIFNFGWSIRRFFGQDQVEIIQFLDGVTEDITKSDQPFWQVRKTPVRYTWHEPALGSATIIAPYLEPDFPSTFSIATSAVAYHQILMAVCDIEFLRAKNQRLPNEAEFAALGRIDPFNGNQLHYVIRGAEYSVYSVGEDGVDDGGLAASGHHAGDIAFNCGKPPERKRVIKNP
jgi:ABC-type transport system involved in cytochrome c biogenesis permease component